MKWLNQFRVGKFIGNAQGLIGWCYFVDGDPFSILAEGEAYSGHLDLLLLWHFVEAHAQPWFLQLAAGLPSPLSSTIKKCIGKTSFFFWRGAQYASFFQVWFTTDRGKNWGLANLQSSHCSLFDAISPRGFFDLNRWWIQQETAPRFYTFGHLRQHPALGALYRVFWPEVLDIQRKHSAWRLDV